MAILFGAAIATVTTITVCLGGVQAWWPTQWPAHCPEPVYGYDPTARVTMFGTCWPRSLGTSARRRPTKLPSNVISPPATPNQLARCCSSPFPPTCWFPSSWPAVGLGLLAYFHAYPHLLPDGQSVLADSDKLFPQFIMIGLPVGISGLVVAGLLACHVGDFGRHQLHVLRDYG